MLLDFKFGLDNYIRNPIHFQILQNQLNFIFINRKENVRQLQTNKINFTQ
jgi:hypothetical protein